MFRKFVEICALAAQKRKEIFGFNIFWHNLIFIYFRHCNTIFDLDGKNLLTYVRNSLTYCQKDNITHEQFTLIQLSLQRRLSSLSALPNSAAFLFVRVAALLPSLALYISICFLLPTLFNKFVWYVLYKWAHTTTAFFIFTLMFNSSFIFVSVVLPARFFYKYILAWQVIRKHLWAELCNRRTYREPYATIDCC